MAKAKAPRAEFALPGGRFPLNTPGRVKVADKDAAIARKAGTINAAEEAKVKRAVARKRGTTRAKTGEGSARDKAEDRRGMKATGMTAKAYEKSARDKREDKARARK